MDVGRKVSYLDETWTVIGIFVEKTDDGQFLMVDLANEGTIKTIPIHDLLDY